MSRPVGGGGGTLQSPGHAEKQGGHENTWRPSETLHAKMHTILAANMADSIRIPSELFHVQIQSA